MAPASSVGVSSVPVLPSHVIEFPPHLRQRNLTGVNPSQVFDRRDRFDENTVTALFDDHSHSLPYPVLFPLRCRYRNLPLPRDQDGFVRHCNQYYVAKVLHLGGLYNVAGLERVIAQFPQFKRNNSRSIRCARCTSSDGNGLSQQSYTTPPSLLGIRAQRSALVFPFIFPSTAVYVALQDPVRQRSGLRNASRRLH